MKKYETTDLWFAAWLKLNGKELVDYVPIHNNKRVQFVFNIDPKELKELRMQFLQSDISKVKQLIEELKDLAY